MVKALNITVYKAIILKKLVLNKIGNNFHRIITHVAKSMAMLT
jgi:hypothetical protein